MEDNSALKIRSDLYPKYIAAIQSSHIASTQDTAAREPSQRIGGLSSVGSISGTTDTSIKNNNNNSLINKDSCRRDSDAIEVRDQYFENANLSSSRLVEHDNQTLCREATPTKVKQFAEPFRTPSERNSPNFSECASSSPPCEVAPEEGNLRRNSEGEEDNDEDEEKIDVVTPDEAVDQLIHRRIVPNVLSSSPLCPKSPIVEFSTPYNIERFYQPSRQVPPDGERGSGTSEEDKRQSFSPLSTFCPFGMIPDVEKLRKMNSLIFQESGQPPSYDPSLYAANLPPHLLPWLISSHLHSLVHYQDQKDQQPLDLSAKKSPEKELMPKVFEVKPSTRGRRRADSGKRNYSEEELNAALHDIQSGKLGTRRAAVLYGIPRSTLRNKVYKLTMERERTKKLIESSDSPASGFLHDQLASFRPNLSLTASDDSGETLKAIIRSKMTEHLEELDQNNQAYLTGVEKQRLLDSSFNHLFENIPKLALNFENKSTPSEVLSTLSLYPQLYDFTQKIVEDRFHEEIKRTKARLNGLSYPPNGFPLGGDDMPICPSSYSGLFNLSTNNNFIFKEDKQESSHSRASPPQENFKDMIAQIINNKLQGDSINDNSNTGSSDSYSSTPIRHYESFNKTDIRSPADKRIQADQGTKKRAKSPSSAAGGKGSRPKRGKYRNYDRDNLLKAVQAVQNGEMSVHRAGSFYGVPHSTLEYKVKERHLHRGKNKKDSVVSLTMPDLLKNNKDNNSPSYMESYGGKNEATEATSDLPRSASHSSNEEVAVISVRPSVPKLKPSREEDHSSSRVTMPQHPFVSNPFPFWNNSSTILAPFLPSPYQTDPLLREIQEKLNNNEDSKDGKVLTNGLTQSQSHEINFSAVSEGLLNSLLRKKIETTNSSEHENAGGCLQLGTSPIAPSGLLNLNALLPSFLTAQSSLVARATICSPHTQGPSMSAKAYAPQSAPLSLVKEAASLKLSLGGLPAAEAP